MEIIENLDEWRRRYAYWLKDQGGISRDGDVGESYPFVINKRAPFVPVRRALSMLSLALISSAGAYLDGTEPFDIHAAGGDVNFREIPIEIEAEDLRFAARGYDPTAVQQDINVQLPLNRLCEFEANRIIGQLNQVFWSFCGFIPDAARLVEETVPRLIERVKRHDVQAALLIPASRLCHQSVSLVARGLEQAGLPTMTLAVARDIVEDVRPPRAACYNGQIGNVVGKPGWPEYQRRVLDEALRLIEPMDQPGVYQLAADLESQVEKQRGER
ncbi:MAG TPA: glycine/sarcosine/betaine reductase selenoprotein B family protein [Pyrinomonadaceae bacterium]|nr:glycine/sarcosine/betaine reductase selenoprotein B family protein [Pyrinomonadaceae bacterium]